ncbi:dsRBD fold-containing protein [Kitasatospora mediocidica]|uniref:dsRBD fold-containing protein n=1 Tax=Kitasatospora mediocidica TaxID=58352 RepID=UPI000566A353|nr:dsRBD fold-containing protein [Kitasatospora mediocidica]
MHNQWKVELSFEEDGTVTACEARLVGVRAPSLNAHAESVRSAADRPANRIGEEVAASRALDTLSRKLHAQAHGDVEDASLRPDYLIY